MIEGLARKVLGASATAHVKSMNGASGLESGMRQAARISRGAGPFQAMNQNQLGHRRAFGRLGIHPDLDARLGVVEFRVYREALLVELALPVVAGDGEQVGIPEKGDEGPQKTILAATGKSEGTAKGTVPSNGHKTLLSG